MAKFPYGLQPSMSSVTSVSLGGANSLEDLGINSGSFAMIAQPKRAGVGRHMKLAGPAPK